MWRKRKLAPGTPGDDAGVDELLANQGLEVTRAANGSGILGQQTRPWPRRRTPCRRSRPAGDHRALAGPEPVEARRQQRRDRRRDRQLWPRDPPSVSMASSCSMNRGLPSAVSSTRGVVARARPRRGWRSATRSLGRGGARARSELVFARLAVPAGSLLEELGTGDANEEYRRTPHPLGQILDQVEERGLRPVQSSKKTTSGRRAAKLRKQAPRCPEDLLALDWRPPRRRSPPRGSRRAAARLGEQHSFRVGGR